jgi:hypothetical protein
LGLKAPKAQSLFFARQEGLLDMYLCYVDESGTSESTGNTSHFVLAGISVPIWHWRNCDKEIEALKKQYELQNDEIHVAWMLRKYPEQLRISGFDALSRTDRRSKVERFRRGELLRLQKSQNHKQYQQTKKNFEKTKSYIHLTLNERKQLLVEVARKVANWGSARLFAECIDKIHFDPTRSPRTIDEQALEQIVSRFQQYLSTAAPQTQQKSYGLLIHDNNQTVALKHTLLMKAFHDKGTFWTSIENIIETPLFVNSQLTSMVQIADLCAYALRRYLENSETELFDLVFQRADRRQAIAVGVRHFTKSGCGCKICAAHRPSNT